MQSFIPKIGYTYKKHTLFFFWPFLWFTWNIYASRASNFLNRTKSWMHFLSKYSRTSFTLSNLLTCHLQNLYYSFPQVAGGTFENMDLHIKQNYLYIFRRNIYIPFGLCFLCICDMVWLDLFFFSLLLVIWQGNQNYWKLYLPDREVVVQQELLAAIS